MRALCVQQERPVQEFWDDFEQQEKIFKQEVAQAKERNAEKKVRPPSSIIAHLVFSFCAARFHTLQIQLHL